MTNAKQRILVVDDDSGMLETLRIVFSLDGYDVVTAQGGSRGLECLEGQDFAFVLSDLRMPDLSGLEFLAEANERVPQTPVLIYTAHGSKATESAARQLGAVAYIDGLWDVNFLLQTVRQKIDSSSTRHGVPVETEGPATRRWVNIVVAAAQSSRDLPTLADWAKEVGKSVGTLKRQCDVCGVHASASLDFARVLRVVMRHRGRKCNWYDVFDIAEPSTMAAFLDRAGFAKDGTVPDHRRFLENQRFVGDKALIWLSLVK
jgi:DNA-binding response OmpR family regulator